MDARTDHERMDRVMPSNFFTRPFGLNPTPQICFPPPPAPPVGNKTWFFTTETPKNIPAAPTSSSLTVNDPDVPFGTPIPYDLELPGTDNLNPHSVLNGQIDVPVCNVIGPAGNYTARVHIHWLDGSTSHGSQPYVIIEL